MLGGAIFCSQRCSCHLFGTELKKNYGKQGGTIYLDANSALIVEYISAESNWALESGGFLAALTNSYFKISYSLITSNAVEDEGAAVYALGTSRNPPFEIDNSLFTKNTGVSNTLSLQYSNGKIIDSKFTDNHAVQFTENVFIGFSNITMTDCKFEDHS